MYIPKIEYDFSKGATEWTAPGIYGQTDNFIYIGEFVCLSRLLDNLDNLYLSKKRGGDGRKYPLKCDDILYSGCRQGSNQNKIWTDKDKNPYIEKWPVCLSCLLSKYCSVGGCQVSDWLKAKIIWKSPLRKK